MMKMTVNKMLKQYKRLGILLLIGIILFNMTLASAEFQEGDVYNSDVNGFADGYPIPVYSYMDYPYILARDLLGYGFDVVYDEGSRSVTVERNTSKAMYPYSKAGNSENKTKLLGKILKSDIKVYIKGEQIPSYNMNGNMLICMDDLYRFGKVNWYEDSKTIAFTSSGFISANPAWETTMPEKYKNYRKNDTHKQENNYYPNSSVPTFTALSAVEMTEEYTSKHGINGYVYPLDENAAVQYISLMCNYMGYEIADKESDLFGTYINYYLKKGDSISVVMVSYDANAIIIIPG